MTRGATSSPTSSAATPTGMASTSCSTPSTGAAQRAGLELLSIGGRFVEIGKRDVYANTRLGLYPFRRNLTFYYVDLALMCDSHPQRVQDLLRTVYRLVADGELPIPGAHRPTH